MDPDVVYIRTHELGKLFNDLALFYISKRTKDPINTAIEYLKPAEVQHNSKPQHSSVSFSSDKPAVEERPKVPVPPPAITTPKEPVSNASHASDPFVVFTFGEPSHEGQDEEEDHDDPHTPKKVAFGSAQGGVARKGLLGTDFFKRHSVAGELILMHQLNNSEESVRRRQWNTVYDIMDLDGNGYVDFYEFQQILFAVAEISESKNEKKLVLRVANELRTIDKANKLGPEDFEELMLNLSRSLKGEAYDEFFDKISSAVDHISSVTQGSRRKRVIWQLFREWDQDANGFLPLEDVQKVISHIPEYESSKQMKKQSAKWGHKLNSHSDGDEDSGHVSLSDFHSYINDLLHGMTDSQFYSVVDRIHREVTAMKNSEILNEPQSFHRAAMGVFRRQSVMIDLAERSKVTGDDLKKRQKAWERLFPLLDMNGSGFVDLRELQKTFAAFDELKNRAEKKVLTKLAAELKSKNMENKLTQEVFVELMVHLSSSMENDRFDEFYEAMNEISPPQDKGAHQTRALYHLFMEWDINRNGYLDYKVVDDLLKTVPVLQKRKAARRKSFQFKAEVQQSSKESGVGFTDQRLGLADFQKLVGNMTAGLTEEQFYEVLDSIHESLRVRRKNAIKR